jgi:flagellar biosynthesis protein FliR
MFEAGDYAVGAILILCRLGTTLMIAPGFSTARVPARVRLYVALALALTLTPAVLADQELKPEADGTLTRMVFAECIVGAVIGLVCRFYLAALEFMCNAIANYIGLSALSAGIDHDEPASPLTTLITMVATLLVLFMELHQLLIETVLGSYSSIPLGIVADPQFGIRMLSAALGSASVTSLQISGPFIVYAILVNLLFGLLGKLIPQVPSYFVSLPFLLMGGMLYLYLMLPEMLKIFSDAFAAVLTHL